MTGVAFSPDGKLLAARTTVDAVQIWRVDEWVLLREMESAQGGMGNVAFSPDGDLLAAGDAYHEIRWWRVADGKVAVKEGLHDPKVTTTVSASTNASAKSRQSAAVRVYR